MNAPLPPADAAPRAIAPEGCRQSMTPALCKAVGRSMCEACRSYRRRQRDAALIDGLRANLERAWNKNSDLLIARDVLQTRYDRMCFACVLAIVAMSVASFALGHFAPVPNFVGWLR